MLLHLIPPFVIYEPFWPLCAFETVKIFMSAITSRMMIMVARKELHFSIMGDVVFVILTKFHLSEVKESKEDMEKMPIKHDTVCTKTQCLIHATPCLPYTVKLPQYI